MRSRACAGERSRGFAANEVTVLVDEHGGYTPTPVISHAIIGYNRNRKSGLADGVVITLRTIRRRRRLQI